MRPFDPNKEIEDYCKHIMHSNEQVRRNKKDTKTWYYDYPAVAVICHNNLCTQKRSGYSHYPNVSEFCNVMKNTLQKLGAIGKTCNKHGKRYIIGNCAEQHAGNRYMIDYKAVSTKELFFSKALRPRTQQIINYCDNCKDIFPNL